jgi:diadenylate cyclase
MLARIPRLPDVVAERLVAEFGALDKLTRASVGEMASVEGVGEHWAVTIKDALARIAESSILDRYA